MCTNLTTNEVTGHIKFTVDEHPNQVSVEKVVIVIIVWLPVKGKLSAEFEESLQLQWVVGIHFV